MDILPIATEVDIALARIYAGRIATSLGVRSATKGRLVTAVSELAWNIVRHAGDGTCTLSVEDDEDGRLVVATFEDHGPGIDDLDAAMGEGFTTRGGLGCGLPGTKRLVDTFHITSRPGKTVVRIGVKAK